MAEAAHVEGQSVATDAHVRHPAPQGRRLVVLSFAALGIVYGDIGTSPLYAIRECFHGAARDRRRRTRTSSASCRWSSGR